MSNASGRLAPPRIAPIVLGVALGAGAVVAPWVLGPGMVLGLGIASVVCTLSAFALGRLDRELRASRCAQDALTEAVEAARRSGALEEAAGTTRAAFLDSVAQQLRGSVGSVGGLADTLLQSQLDPMQEQATRTLRGACDNVGALVDELVGLSRLERGGLDVHAGPFDPGRLAEELVATLHGGAAAQGVQLGVLVEADVPDRVLGDARRVRQVLLHLLHHLIPATPGGSVLLVVRSRPGGFTLRLEAPGLALPQEARAALQGRSTEIPGLALVHRLVATLEGDVQVEDEALSLHVAARDVVAAAPPERIGGGAVLVVCEGAAARVVSAYASRFGADTVCVPSLAEALVRLQRGGWSALLVDGVLLDGAGVTTLAALEYRPPTVVLTTPGGVDLRPLGAVATVAHPVHRSTLYGSLAALLPNGTSTRISEPRVLLVDDNPVNRLVARKFLERLGYQIDEAVNGQEAVEMASPGRYVAILMDLQMPVMNGYDATREIHRQLARSAPPIIAVTANVLPADKERAMASGMVEHLGKPLDARRLQQVLERWIPDGLRRSG